MSQPGTAVAGRLRRPSLAVALSTFWVVAVIVCAALAPFMAPYDSAAADPAARLAAPMIFGGDEAHPLGTDGQGRDLLSRVLFGAQFSLLIAVVGTVAGAAIGIALGTAAALRRGWFDDLVLGLVNLQRSIPFLIVAVAAIAFLGNSLIVLMAVVSLYGWERHARLSRALGLSMTAGGFAEAVAAYGARPLWIFWRHILPNSAGGLLVNVALAVPATFLLESVLSVLGLGVQPPQASLGTIVHDGLNHLREAWWVAVIPGAIITVTVLAAGTLGDRWRDQPDPAFR